MMTWPRRLGGRSVAHLLQSVPFFPAVDRYALVGAEFAISTSHMCAATNSVQGVNRRSPRVAAVVRTGYLAAHRNSTNYYVMQFKTRKLATFDPAKIFLISSLSTTQNFVVVSHTVRAHVGPINFGRRRGPTP